MEKTLQIKYQKHNGILRLFLFFRYDQSFIAEIRKHLPARWSSSAKAWHIPPEDNYRDKVIKLAQTFKYEIKSEDKPAIVNWHPLPNTYWRNLLERFEKKLRSEWYSENTIRTYTEALSIFFRFFHDKKAEEINQEDIIRFNNDYIIARGYSQSYQNQVINAIKFFFREMMHTQLNPELINRPRREKKLPNVLSQEEVRIILKQPANLKHRAMLSLIYACGLRCGELLHLRPTDIDAERKLLVVRQAKGKKDRVVPLSEKIINLLREYWLCYKTKVYLFEGQRKGELYDARSLQQVLKQAVSAAGIKKPVSLHWLRHSYATHLLENGTDLRYIQEILGHRSSKTTEIYTHVSRRSIQNIVSPFDYL